MAVLDRVLRLPVVLAYLCSTLWSALPPVILSVPTLRESSEGSPQGAPVLSVLARPVTCRPECAHAAWAEPRISASQPPPLSRRAMQAQHRGGVAGSTPSITTSAALTYTNCVTCPISLADPSTPPTAAMAPPYAAAPTLNPDMGFVDLYGELRDERTGQPVENAVVQVYEGGEAPRLAHVDERGRFVVTDAQAARTLLVKAPGYELLFVPAKGPSTAILTLKPFQAKGIYIPFNLLALPNRVIELLDMVDRTELNAVVVDVKSDYAQLAWPSRVPLAVEASAYYPGLMDLREFLRECRKRDIYAIARMVVFKDDRLARAQPELAVKRADGRPYVDWEGLHWSDPFSQKVRDYNLALAQEVIALGFDEVQFDYLRFPSDGQTTGLLYEQESTPESRTAAMAEFCRQAHEMTRHTPAFLSGDVFGFAVWVDGGDMGIGQRVDDLADHMDYVSPMLYPSTFVSGNLGLDEPLRYPYQVINRSVKRLQARSPTRVRPWLQHYSRGGVTYGPSELLAQKKGAEDAGSCGWIYWNAAGRYRPEVFQAEAYDP